MKDKERKESDAPDFLEGEEEELAGALLGGHEALLQARAQLLHRHPRRALHVQRLLRVLPEKAVENSRRALQRGLLAQRKERVQKVQVFAAVHLARHRRQRQPPLARRQHLHSRQHTPFTKQPQKKQDKKKTRKKKKSENGNLQTDTPKDDPGNVNCQNTHAARDKTGISKKEKKKKKKKKISVKCSIEAPIALQGVLKGISTGQLTFSSSGSRGTPPYRVSNALVDTFKLGSDNRCVFNSDRLIRSKKTTENSKILMTEKKSPNAVPIAIRSLQHLGCNHRLCRLRRTQREYHLRNGKDKIYRSESRKKYSQVCNIQLCG
jgi:hypothetical protein